MDIFVGAETTVDVDFRELRVLEVFEKALTKAAARPMAGLKFLGIICIIMNPEIAKPFPPGVIFRKPRGMVDAKVSVDFATWARSDSMERIKLIATGAKSQIQRVERLPMDVRNYLSEVIDEAMATVTLD